MVPSTGAVVARPDTTPGFVTLPAKLFPSKTKLDRTCLPLLLLLGTSLLLLLVLPILLLTVFMLSRPIENGIGCRPCVLAANIECGSSREGGDIEIECIVPPVLAAGIEGGVKLESSIDGIRKADIEVGDDKSLGGFRPINGGGEYSSPAWIPPAWYDDRSSRIISSSSVLLFLFLFGKANFIDIDAKSAVDRVGVR